MSRLLRIAACAASLIVLVLTAAVFVAPRGVSAAGSPFEQLFQDHSQILGGLTNILNRLGIIRQLFKPDLLPLPTEGYPAYCNPNGDGSALIVTVANQGFGQAGASTTRVVFTTSDGPVAVDRATPTIEAGEGGEVALTFPFPSSCFIPNCNFTIRVDAFNDVTESNGINNNVTDSCLG